MVEIFSASQQEEERRGNTFSLQSNSGEKAL
jgi:hypothetical protein